MSANVSIDYITHRFEGQQAPTLQDEVAHIARQDKLTLFIVTHDIDEAVAMAGRVLIMAANPGRIVGELAVDLPAPRDRYSSAFSRAREQLMTNFEALVGDGRAAAEVTDAAARSPAPDQIEAEPRRRAA